MTITLGTNIPSLIARSNLNGLTKKLSSTYERFTTGSRINRAGDDAAGLVISQNMEALIGGSKQAQNNIQTAGSYLKVAEEGMVAVGDHLRRINDLLINMANGTNDTESNTAAVREIIERLNEVDRLTESTNFNGKTMLDGTVGKIYVQLGADSTDLSVIDISPALTDCHVSAFGAQLPDNLNPDAYSYGGKTYYKISKGVYEDKDGNKYVGSEDNLTPLFDPTNENCRDYLQIIQDAISTLTTSRGLIGAYENRMDGAYDAMTSRITALEDAKSVYVDIDVAEESTNLTTQQILQQVSIAILSNSNSSQAVALSLLGG